MFSVLEAIQSAANPGINATIKDKYFNSASTIPATVFPVLLNLAQKHLRKLKSSNTGLVIFYEKQLSELAETIGDTFPARLNLPQQGSFQLGYYHQTAARYQKKEENNNV
jgi:CRISPR-associated protein Csd1